MLVDVSRCECACCLPKQALLHEQCHVSQQVMTEYLWSYMTPWLQADINVVTHTPHTDVFENSPFLALHVRRGDKLIREAKMHFCEVGVYVCATLRNA